MGEAATREHSRFRLMTRLNGERGSIFFDQQIFLSLLDKELTRAERYNNFVALLLLGVEGGQKREQAAWLARLAEALPGKVRRSDHFGDFDEATLGVILICAGAEKARIVLERLRFEALLCLSGGPQEIHLKTSYAVCPSEANLLESLCDLAIHRLTDQEYNA